MRSETEIRGDVMKRENLPPGKARAMARLRLADDAADLLARAVGAEAELAEAQAKIAAVIELHQEEYDYGASDDMTKPYCSVCRPLLVPWPCPTLRVLGLPADTTAPNPMSSESLTRELAQALHDAAVPGCDRNPCPAGHEHYRLYAVACIKFLRTKASGLFRGTTEGAE